MYFDDIKRVVEAAPDASYAVSTNGVNLERYLPFFREHRFLVCISYDGSGDDTRGFDPFTKLIEYPWIAVSCTLYHGNTDFRRILANFVAKERIVGRNYPFSRILCITRANIMSRSLLWQRTLMISSASTRSVFLASLLTITGRC